MKIVSTEFIRATPAAVLAAVADFASYPQWNPWIVRAEGVCKTGADVVVDAWVGGRLGRYRHKIVQFEPSTVLHWCDVGWFTRFVDGERIRTCVPQAGGTCYRVELNVSGPLAFLAQWLFGGSLALGLSRETQALKAYVEARAGI